MLYPYPTGLTLLYLRVLLPAVQTYTVGQVLPVPSSTDRLGLQGPWYVGVPDGYSWIIMDKPWCTGFPAGLNMPYSTVVGILGTDSVEQRCGPCTDRYRTVRPL